MKRKWNITMVTAFIAALVTGCASVETAKVNFMTPGNDGIALTPGSRIKLVSRGDQKICNTIKGLLAYEFKKVADKNVQEAVILAAKQGKDVQKAKSQAESKQIQISDINPDYWLFFSINKEYRRDSEDAAALNRFAYRSKEDNQSGGREIIALTPPLKTGSAAAIVTMTLYSVHDLVPIHSFDLTIYDSEMSPEELRNENQYIRLFIGETVKRIKDGFLTMEREMTVHLPTNANGALISALKSKNSQKVREVAKRLKLSTLYQFLEKVKALENEQKPKLFDEAKIVEEMANHYVLAVDFESKNLDTKSLHLVYNIYLSILKNTHDDLLAEACANSLARIERKLELLEAVRR